MTCKDTPVGPPSQDPNPCHQQPLSADEARKEAATTGMGAGVVAGAAGGAMLGTAIAGPAGTLAGAAAGAVLGALGGYAAVDARDPDYAYWNAQFQTPPSGSDGDDDGGDGHTHDDYAPAWRLGYQGRRRYALQEWAQAEPLLQKDWEHIRSTSRLSWEQARDAVHAAWDRAQPSPADPAPGADPH